MSNRSTNKTPKSNVQPGDKTQADDDWLTLIEGKAPYSILCPDCFGRGHTQPFVCPICLMDFEGLKVAGQMVFAPKKDAPPPRKFSFLQATRLLKKYRAAQEDLAAWKQEHPSALLSETPKRETLYPSCGHVFDDFLNRATRIDIACPKCKGERRIMRLLTPKQAKAALYREQTAFKLRRSQMVLRAISRGTLSRRTVRLLLPKCGAQTRSRDRHPCPLFCIPGKVRCHLHGGKSTGPSEEGRARIAETQRARHARNRNAKQANLII